MSIYKKVDFYELCRLCMCVGGKKHHLFKSQESSDRQLQFKLKKCIPLQIKETDNLPKGVCENCITKMEEFYDFIDQCVNTESMLKSYCATLSVSDQAKCQGKVYVRESLENDSSSTKKNDSSNHSSSIHMIQSLSNLVQSGSIQIVNDINSRCQDFCKYDNMQQVITSTTNGVESMKYNYTVANNSNQSLQTDSSNEENDASENVQTIYSIPDIPSSDKEDSEMNIHSLSYVTPLTVEPEMLHFQFNKSDNDQDSDLDNSKSSDKTYMNGFLPTDGALASCTACGKVLESEEEIVMHSQMCKAINNRSVSNLPTRSARDMMPPRFPCDICEKKFKRKEHLIQHRKLHTGERPYSCETCSKSFSRKEHLMRHMLSHTGQRLYGCDLCHKHFSRKDNLHKHRTTHGVTGPLVCEVCGKSFIVKHYYDMHMATHNEVEDNQLPYVCDICKKRFATSQFLVTHQFKHHTKRYTNDLKSQSGSVIEKLKNELQVDLQGKQNLPSNVPNTNTYQVTYEDNNL
ncbi:PREDICTED: zinc finger protein 436-like [Diuraphis noxia]|uniref:zinc finger protein 436-like n=1 Tax=Diuraphis noxia TaxID=143948 RepID=UPI000763606F|nr:PREDICTED: zinc finger protein 436-like [Diuraphis noxia]